MLPRFLAFLLVAALPVSLWSQESQGTQAPQGNEETKSAAEAAPNIRFLQNMPTKNGFSAALLLSPSRAIFEEVTPNVEHLEPVGYVRRGSSVYTVVLFANAATRLGKVDLTYDVVIKKPDGSVYGEGKSIPGWNNRRPATPGLVHIAAGTVKIQIDPEDPNGKYLVAADIHDNARGVTIHSEQVFVVR